MKVFVMLMILAGLLFAEKLSINLDIVCNEVGDAKVIWTQQATAAQWQALMQKYGNNPALLKREIIYSMPGSELSNFQFQKDEMNRKFIFSFDAAGVVEYKGGGKWHFQYEKKYTPRKINDKTWFFTYSESPAPGSILEYDITLKLPPKAKNAHLARNEFDEPVVEYELKPKFISSISLFVWIGMVLMVGGILLVIASFFGKESQQA